jgi:hypothetical protein
MMNNLRTLVAMAFAAAAFAMMPSRAMAQNYSGNWPLTWNITFGHTGTITYCLTLTDNGSAGFPHSGPAVLNGSGEDNLEGLFQIVNNHLVVTFYVPGSDASIAGLVFVGSAGKSGDIGKGFGELVSGAETNLGPLMFGKKNGCGNTD